MSSNDAINHAVELIESIMKDASVPRNIKNTCKNVLERLIRKDEADHIRAGAATCILDELSQDANLPFHTRAQVWEIASILETVKVSKE